MFKKNIGQNRYKKKSQSCKSAPASKSFKLVASTGCAEDDAAVATLPAEWNPKHGGPLLKKYLKEREQYHEKILVDITKCAIEVNKGIDCKVRSLSENLLAHIQEKQLELDCIIAKCEFAASPMSKEIYEEALKETFYVYNQRVEEIDTFKREALFLERERGEKIKVLLREHFQRLITVGHLPPKELLHNFDERAYEINQQLLSNCRAYSDLEAHLRAQLDDCVRRVRSILNQLSLGIKRSARGKSALPTLRQVRESQQMRSYSLERTRSSSLPSINESLDTNHEFSKLLLQIYRTGKIGVYTTFFEKFTELEKNLESGPFFQLENDNINEIINVRPMIDKTIQSFSINTTKTSMEEIEANQLTIEKSLFSLAECLRNAYTILYEADHLWYDHNLRLAIAQKLTLAAVEDLVTNNDSVELANEITFNIALEQLRSANDADKLKQQYEIVVTMLDRTAEMYIQHSKNELDRLEEFMNLPTIMSNILSFAQNYFLESNSKVLLRASHSILSQHSIDSGQIDSFLGSPLSHEILQTEMQEMAIADWRNGFLEAFEKNLSLVIEDLTRQACLWVEEKAEVLHMRYSLKMIAHSIRAERIKAAYKTRLAELSHHESRLQSHFDAVYRVIDSLPKEASEFLALDAPELYPFCEWINRLQSDMESLLSQDPLDPEVKKLKMNSYAIRLVKHRRMYEESLDSRIVLFIEYLKHSVHEARISNGHILSQIILFNENGKYSAQEANKTCIAIMKSSDALESCLTRSMDALNNRRSQLLSQADQYMVPMRVIVDENFKSKQGIDRNKPLPKKKK